MPRHSSSVDMLIADLGHLELQNEFQVFELDSSKEKVVFDMMELTLQSVQLARLVLQYNRPFAGIRSCGCTRNQNILTVYLMELRVKKK